MWAGLITADAEQEGAWERSNTNFDFYYGEEPMSLERRRQEVGLRTSASRMDVKTRLLLQSLVQLLPDCPQPQQACPVNSRSLLLHTHTHTLQKKKKWSEFPPKGMVGSVGEVVGAGHTVAAGGQHR